MRNTETAFLSLIRAALHSGKLSDPGLTLEEWRTLLRLSESHKLLPLILDTAWPLPGCRSAVSSSEEQKDGLSQPDAVRAPDWRNVALKQTVRQALQENDFLNLILGLQARGLDPVVLKGPVCRALYPQPLLRPSEDDDLLIPAGSGPAYHEALLALGMLPFEPEADLDRGTELCYYKPESSLFVEFNTCLFEKDSAAFRGFNEPFAGALDRTVPIRIQDVTLRTLAPTDHLLFLILHAFKHFIHSGFGLRIVADICLYARHYAAEIDFDRTLAVYASLRCDCFTAAVFRIGERYLELPAPEPFAAMETDETDLLEDILSAGIHGAEIERLHSARITLGAVADRNAGKTPSGSLRSALFPSRKTLTLRYPWLEERPWLLPAAWVSRIGSYVKNRGKYGNESPAATVRLGRERVKLLEEYGIIDRE